ncbi:MULTISPECIES: isoprenylcysteine carboxylmethyltransferase family protein [unclassified Lentimicrobium]|uniref:methyltransferase family protein n=1 Tax=unclassified Lentimicrobium TaxID=2677434 RepID=UPI001552671B|nr:MULTISPECIES: isoprenylcysteine carboxylmethyltransferase family protein [unclassified Lentimicrobium]NPD45064.1 isoprenylcysteine carboxylmethyltransferase family protein [Lentimicrobium sp. S6]NPD84538.1 isoprenylcysteine carboxylmethyltransferase family protein [Lentimicrobium sp. L6]
MQRKKESKPTYAYLLVFLQFSSLFIVMFTAPVLANHLVLLMVQVLGVFVGLWAIWVMRIGNFNITPTPVINGELRKSGPYAMIRHPMYTSIFLFTLPELVNSYNLWRLSVVLILYLTLIFKINFEEKNLLHQFPEYKIYQKKTKKIIPFVY